MKEKRKNKKLVVLLVILCLLLAGAGVGVAMLTGILTFSGANQCTLYWNMSEQVYLDSAGLSTRKVEDDGFYHVLFAVDGEQVEYKVADKTLVDAIDNRSIMGLVVDRKGIITDVLDPEEICDGEMISKWYIVSMEKDGFKVRQTKGAESGLSYTVKITEDTGIYDVAGEEPIGHATTLEVGDCVRVFRNFDKEVNYVFVVKGDDYFDGNIITKYCEHCDAEVDWYEWTKTDEVPTTTGHWCLANDINIDYQANIEGYNNVIIDLNGHTIEAVSARRVICVGSSADQGTLAILDQSESGTGKLKASGSTKSGGVVQVKAGTFELYSGTIDASEVVSEYYGMAIYMASNTTCNMYGGTIIGGTSVCGVKYDGKYTGGGSGSVHVLSGAVFTLYDGTIRDGKALSYKIEENRYTSGAGGNVSVRAGGTFIMEGGEILDGIADRSGGNVYMASQNATFIMRGGLISGGANVISGGRGGNIYISADSIFTLEDGTVKDGVTMKGNGGNIAVYGMLTMSGGNVTGGLSVDGETFETAVRKEDAVDHNIFGTTNGVLQMSGGSVDGYVELRKTTCTVNISGKARITGGEHNLTLPAGLEMRIDKLEKGAKIGVSGIGFISEETSSKYLSYLYCDYENVDIKYYKSKFFVGKMGCICGGSHINSDGNVVKGHYGACDGTVLEWLPWVQKTTAPTTNGNWYLMTDVELTAQQAVAANSKVVLDLNGHTILGEDAIRVYNITKDKNIHMTITDTSEKQNGKIVSTGEGVKAGSCMLILPGNKVVMYAGTLDAHNFTGPVDGVALAIRSTSSFTMYGGTIIGGTAQGKSGGSVVVEGEFLLHDGIIRDGKADSSGGNIYAKSGKLSVLGGKIIDGTAKQGGNIRITKDVTFVVSDGSISGGTATDGGNVYIPLSASMTMTGGAITEGTAKDRGGNIYDRGNITVTGGVISKGEATYYGSDGNEAGSNLHGLGGNIYANGKDKNNRISLTITGGTIKDGKANGRGGNIELYSFVDLVADGKDSAVVISGGEAVNGGNIFAQSSSSVTVEKDVTVKGGVAKNNGGNLFFNGSNLAINGGTFKEGTATYGGNIYTKGASTMSGGTISKGNASAYGGNIYNEGTLTIQENVVISEGTAATRAGNVYNINTLNITGGVIRNGSVSETETNAYGGNIYTTSQITMSGGEISGGKAHSGGNVSLPSAGSMEMSGGTISEGTATTLGGNVYTKGTFTMSGGTISKGNAGTYGGNINNEGTLTIQDGVISEGTAATRAGNVYNTNTLNITGGAIRNGSVSETATNAYGGNVYTTSKITMSGGEISGGKAYNGGNVSLPSTGSMEMSGGTISGGKAYNGGNVSISSATGSMEMSGGTISEGTATASGGNVFTKGAFTISDGSVSKGTADIGGNIYTEGTLIIQEKGNVNNGVSATSGGNIYATKTVTVSGGSISGGSAKNGGSVYVSSDASMTVSGGTISKGNASAYGGNIYNEGTLTIQDGVISEGTAATRAGNVYNTKTLNITGGAIRNGSVSETATNAYGGNVYTTSKITMSGGEISGGKAHNGGNVSIPSAGSMEMSGGTIRDGIAKVSGGNVYAKGAFTITGGVIRDGSVNEKAENACGGNIYTTSQITMSGGEISGGKAYNGGNVSISTAGSMEMLGGTISKGVATTYGGNIYNQGRLLIKDTASVNYGAATYGGNVYTEGTVDVEGATVSENENTTVEELKNVLSGKNISVLGDSITTFEGISNGDIADTTNSTIRINKHYYTKHLLPSWKETYWGRMVDKYNMNLLVNNSASGAYILTDRSESQPSGITRCIELHDNTGDNAGTEPDIIAVYMGTNDLIKGIELGELTEATYNAVKTQSGEYITPTTFTEGYIILLDKMMNRYQNADVFCFTLLPTSNSNSNETLLYDYNVRIREIAEHYKVAVVDIASESGITLDNYTQLQTGSHPLAAGMSWMADVFERALGTKYGVEISPYVANISKGAATNGGNIYVAADASLVIKSGVIRDGHASTTTSNEGVGGNIFNQGTLTVSGGTIIGGTAIHGGSIYTSKTLNVAGGTISNGFATENGGNIYATETVTVSGGSINGGSAKNGGSVYLSSAATMTLSGGTISKGNASAYGGNIYNEGTLTVQENGVISEGTAVTRAGNVYNTNVLNITGGAIRDGRLSGEAQKEYGGNVYTTSKITMSGGEISGGKAVSGGNICIPRAGSMEMSGGTISEGAATVSGGNVYAIGAFTISGGVIRDGSVDEKAENAYGGNIFTTNQIMMSGGEISGGKAYNGGNVSIGAAGSMEMSGGTIRDGKASAHGGNIYNEGTLIIKDNASVADGIAENGGNIYLQATQTSKTNGAAANMTMNGGTIQGGKATSGGSIYIQRGIKKDGDKTYSTPAAMIMNDGTIQGGWATTSGGNIYCYGRFTMNGGTIKEGLVGTSDTDVRGGNLYGYGANNTDVVGEITINQGSIIDGMATGRGGNIHLQHAKLYLGEGLITVTSGQKVKVTDSNTKPPTIEKKSTVIEYVNVSVFGSTTNKIQILGKMNAESRIGVTASTPLGVLVTNATETLDLYKKIFVLNSTNRELSLTDNKLSIIESSN